MGLRAWPGPEHSSDAKKGRSIGRHDRRQANTKHVSECRSALLTSPFRFIRSISLMIRGDYRIDNPTSSWTVNLTRQGEGGTPVEVLANIATHLFALADSVPRCRQSGSWKSLCFFGVFLFLSILMILVCTKEANAQGPAQL